MVTIGFILPAEYAINRCTIDISRGHTFSSSEESSIIWSLVKQVKQVKQFYFRDKGQWKNTYTAKRLNVRAK